MQPQTEPNVIAYSIPGMLYTASFIPKFIDRSAASFLLLDNGNVRVYDGAAKLAMEVPASSIKVKTHGTFANNKVNLNIQGTDYIFRADTSSQNMLTPLGGIVGVSQQMSAMKDTNAFFELLAQPVATVAAVPTEAAATPVTTPAQDVVQPIPVTPSQPLVQSQVQPQAVPAQIAEGLRKRSHRLIVLGWILTGAGVVLTVGSYIIAASSPNGGTFYIFWWLVVVGVALLVRGYMAKRKL